MDRKRALSFLVAGLIALAGCSSSDEMQTNEATEEGDIFENPDAVAETAADANSETDLVPEEGFDANPESEVTDASFSGDTMGSEAETTPEPTPVLPPSELPAPVAVSDASQSYTVQAGDTLMKIAFEVYGNVYEWHKIYELNQSKLSDPNVIPAGTVLQVNAPSTPPAINRSGEKYLIRSGDTLGTISKDVYGTEQKWKKIWENNRELIRDPNKIYAGFHLYYIFTPEDEKEKQDLTRGLASSPAPSPAPASIAPAQVQPASAPTGNFHSSPPLSPEDELMLGPAGDLNSAPAPSKKK